MSAERTDVRAVMDAIEGWAREVSDQFIDSEDGMRSEYVQDLRNYREARSAVAELIEVNKRIASIAHKKAGGGWWMVPNTEMTDLRAALARVQGDTP